MIDGIKCWDVITNLDKDYLKFNGLIFSRNQINNHGITGSIHKFNNDGKHNADDFTLSRLKKTFNDLYDNFYINPNISKLNSLEFGVNIHLNIQPEIVLNSILLFHNKKGNRQKDYIEFSFDSYCLKVYSKSAIGSTNLFQTGMILRIELRVRKMRFFDKYKLRIEVLSDLLNKVVFEQFEQILIRSIKDFLIAFLSDKDILKLSENELNIYYKYTNTNFWLKLKGSNKHRELKKFNQFIQEYSSINIKEILIQLIQEKCKDLRDVESANKINSSWNEITNFTHYKPTPKRCLNSKTGYNSNIPNWKDNTIKIKDVSVPSKAIYSSYCKGCGKIINNPRKNQIYCSASDVGKFAARKCRDKVYKPIAQLKKRMMKIYKYSILFDPTPYIEPETLLVLKRQKLLLTNRSINSASN